MTGEELRRIRRGLGLTQVKLAALLGVTSTTVARWERGERSISEPIARLVNAVRAQRTAKGKRRWHAKST